MSDDAIARLLVVDDEESICLGCRRILSPRGFQVETSSHPREALERAAERDYAAILLDVKMPAVNGIEFLQRLRAVKPEVPVVLITAYPCVPDAAAAVRLGAADYLTKPFTPEELTRAVERALGRRSEGSKETAGGRPLAASPAAGLWASPKQELCFLDESWLQPAAEGRIRVGALLAPAESAGVERVLLPRVGATVYQGLPLAGLLGSDKLLRTLPSPLSGEVVAVNRLLQERPAALWEEPFGEGWIARLSPARLDEEVGDCKPRRVILVNPDQTSAQAQSAELTAIGCQVRVAAGWEELAHDLPHPDCPALLVDACSLGQRGPALVEQARAAAPELRIVVIAAASSEWEAAYRAHPIFYYAVAPFADREIIQILNSVFCPQSRLVGQTVRRRAGSESASSIFITNHHGKHVGLFVAGGLSCQHDGLGWHVKQKLLEALYPVRIATDLGPMSQAKLMVAAGMNDRLLVLLPKDLDRLPGSLVCDDRAKLLPLAGEVAAKTTLLAVQPASPGAGLTGFDERTVSALADHVVRAMARPTPD